MKFDTIFTYAWHIDEREEDVTSIRVYGLSKTNENMCLRIDDFTPYVYVELPEEFTWTTSNSQLLGSKIDEMMGRKRPLKKCLVFKKKLYGVHLEKDGSRKTHPYLLLSFSNRKDIKYLTFNLRNPVKVNQFGTLKLKVHESDADPILQLTCYQNISMAGWVQFQGLRVNVDEQVTTCDLEYTVKWKNLKNYEMDLSPLPKCLSFDIEVNSSNPSAMPDPKKKHDKVFQISCVFSRPGDTRDKYDLFLLTLGDPTQSIVGDDVTLLRFDTEFGLLEGFTELINKENPNIICGYNILCFDIPYMIDRAKFNMCLFNFDKQGFHKHLHSKEDVIRWKSNAYGSQEFTYLNAEGRVFVDLLPLIKRDFKLNNYKLTTVAEHFIGESKDPLNAKGIFKCYRVGIKRNESGNFTKNAKKAMAICGKYCMQDAVLVSKLMDHTQTWFGLTEMANTCCVSIFALYTQGQQIKVYSQLYKYCMYENIVVEKDAYQVKDNERYIGAHVFDPVPGKYENVVPFDFSSLYPTTIIAYNIDYHTWVKDDSPISDELCHVMEWEEHIGCEHDPKVIRKQELDLYIESQEDKLKAMRSSRDKLTLKQFMQGDIDRSKARELREKSKEQSQKEINKLQKQLKPYREERSNLNKSKPKFPMCAKRHYRFLKEPKGVLPTIIQNLLDARKKTRKVDMIKCKEKINILTKSGEHQSLLEQKSILDVLNKRQLAYKVSANSMYGAMGVRRGYLPFMPGAMCTTYMGRTNIEIVAKTIPEKFGGHLIYGDTDSNYITFPHLKTSQETWDYSLKVAEEVTKLFPPPINLEFEEAIYAFFFILTKKRYMYKECMRDGVINHKIGKKGVLLARRDNSCFVRDVYERVIEMISENISMEDVMYYVITQIQKLFSYSVDNSKFVITKAVGNYNDLEFEVIEGSGKVGDYSVPTLSDDEQTREEQFLKKGVSDEREFYLSCLPGQVQLAHKLKVRGQRVDTGSRLEYVVIDPNRHSDNLSTKLECIEYFKRHHIIKIDHYYYLKALSTPLDQVLNVAFQKKKGFQKDFVLSYYNRANREHRKMLNEIKGISNTIIQFE